MRAHSSPVQSLAFNQNGRFLATGDTSRVIRAWLNSALFLDASLQSANLKVRATERIRGMAFSPDGNRLYVLCGDTLRAFDLLTRGQIWSYQPPRSFGFLVSSPQAVAVSPSGNVVTVSDVGEVVAMTADGHVLHQWWDNEAPRYLSFIGDGPGIVGADGFSVSVWDAYTGRKLRRLRTRERIYGMAVDPLKQVVATRTLHSVDLIDAQTLLAIDRLPAPSGLPLISFSPEGSALALGGKEEVLILDLQSKRCFVLPTHGARVVSLAYHPSGFQLAAGCSDGAVRFWDLATKAAA